MSTRDTTEPREYTDTEGQPVTEVEVEECRKAFDALEKLEAQMDEDFPGWRERLGVGLFGIGLAEARSMEEARLREEEPRDE